MELTSELTSILNQSESSVADQGQGNLRTIAQVFESVADFVNETRVEIEPVVSFNFINFITIHSYDMHDKLLCFYLVHIQVVKNLVQSLDSLLQWNETVLVNESSSK